MAWRAFSGLLGEWAWFDETVDDWDEARRLLASQLESFRTDECDDCRRQGTEALDQLQDTVNGAAFQAEVDGHDYALIKT